MTQNNNYVIIDDIPVEINGEKNLLELIRKINIQLPTFCYHSELSIYGACRMCMVENEKGGLEAACSTPPKPGMVIKTNTERLRKYRKNILELLLANHCRDCTICSNNGKCKLQDLAMRFNIKLVRYTNTAEFPDIDSSSFSIMKDANKCILCGDCVRMCNEIQNVGAIDFTRRGSKMTVSTAFDIPILQSNCVSCGQCAAVCPTGAIVVKDDTEQVWSVLSDPNCKVTVQIAPAVRVAVGKEFGLGSGVNGIGKIVAALKLMGFNEVYDTSTGADLTVLEEANEFIGRVEKGEKLPLFTSCCPAWVKFLENKYPEFVSNVSTCRSPMQMFASVIKQQAVSGGKRHVHVAIMPCTAKKSEAKRDEFKVDGVPNVDYVLTTQEIIQMIKESGIVFEDLEPEAVDMAYGWMSGAAVIFGVTGGVTEAVLRRVSNNKSNVGLRQIAYTGIRGLNGVKETTIPFGDKQLRIAVVSGLKNTTDLIERIKGGEHFDLVEVMACPDGCINGGGQPYATAEERSRRSEGLYAADKLCSIRRSEENPLMMSLYNGVLKGRVHELLHVDYTKKK
ncbi:MAG: [FeFe] hydrogenase, group A [Candidatus Limimorpha sp.]